MIQGKGQTILAKAGYLFKVTKAGQIFPSNQALRIILDSQNHSVRRAGKQT
jgi:hypothetical protein